MDHYCFAQLHCAVVPAQFRGPDSFARQDEFVGPFGCSRCLRAREIDQAGGALEPHVGWETHAARLDRRAAVRRSIRGSVENAEATTPVDYLLAQCFFAVAPEDANARAKNHRAMCDRSASEPAAPYRYFSPEDASPSITRRCSTTNRMSTGAMAIRLAAIITG